MSALTVCLTSPQPGNDRLAGMLRGRDIMVWQLPLLEYAPPADNFAALDAAIDDLSLFTHIVFTSPTAVAVFQERLQHHGDVALNHLKVATVGESTAKLCAEYGFPVHFIPETPTGKALGELLTLQMANGSHVLFPQVEGGRGEFAEAMTAAHIELNVIPTYRTLPVHVDVATWKHRMENNVWQGLVVTSPKGLHRWLDVFDPAWCHEIMKGRLLFVMGSTTHDTAKHLGFRRIKSPPHTTLESVAEFISSLREVLQAGQ